MKKKEEKKDKINQVNPPLKKNEEQNSPNPAV